jgi:hypothetical protein
MRAAHQARETCTGKLAPEELRTLVGGHCYNAHCHNRAAVRRAQRIRELGVRR